jgi:hypothetical protein
MPIAHLPKSAAATQAALQQAFSQVPELGGSRPFGTMPGESAGMPMNYRPPTANIYVRNWSRTQSWKRLWIPVSMRRGADEALMRNKELQKIYNADMMYRAVEDGKDMSLYRTEIHPVIFNITIPGGPDGKMGSFPSRLLAIPPAIDADTEPPKVRVPEGTWDLYLGNYERMRSQDPLERQEARRQWALYWGRRHNPVFRVTDDGESEDRNNEFGVLEFIREPIVAVETQLDKEYLLAMDIAEAS